ncbi:MAG: class II histone deacetylase [Chloroflexi bacterium AL-W]|nr:class II histone deacetylase [Chloroflexi bacterium AL-N1]NOK64924.1 class II histone deacetylase [Chloroflexi bacterium AL-N10]NOK76694.1 class II histone deacetylase [Chloroflexi bacterium AL-N5]NOK84585.1 class II histone deacetylase [Chloroflexi bacterium AL-W]NOK86590.1 class II histone deacetylase [Chloroflexi bacterium AL-N15]
MQEAQTMGQSKAFLHDELCLWHTTGEHTLVLPVGGCIQPPASASHAELPESKCRFKTLMDMSDLTTKLDYRSVDAATEEDLLCVHTATYIEQFKAISDERGGERGLFAPFGKGGYEIACLSVGLVKQAIADVVKRMQ